MAANLCKSTWNHSLLFDIVCWEEPCLSKTVDIPSYGAQSFDTVPPRQLIVQKTCPHKLLDCSIMSHKSFGRLCPSSAALKVPLWTHCPRWHFATFGLSTFRSGLIEGLLHWTHTSLASPRMTPTTRAEEQNKLHIWTLWSSTLDMALGQEKFWWQW